MKLRLVIYTMEMTKDKRLPSTQENRGQTGYSPVFCSKKLGNTPSGPDFLLGAGDVRDTTDAGQKALLEEWRSFAHVHLET